MNNWLGVVSRSHVVRGVAGGFAQVCHGKSAPLARMKSGDRLVYYSPSEELGGRPTVRAFTAIGTIKDDHIFAFEMAPGFVPFRRNVVYDEHVRSVSVDELRLSLELTQMPNWGMALRRGLLPLSAADFATTARAMGAAFAS